MAPGLEDTKLNFFLGTLGIPPAFRFGNHGKHSWLQLNTRASGHRAELCADALNPVVDTRALKP